MVKGFAYIVLYRSDPKWIGTKDVCVVDAEGLDQFYYEIQAM